MKSNFVHVCFVVDRSGSMWGSENDVIGGFNSTVEEQKKVKDGKCSISLYEFEDNVELKYRGIDVNEIDEFTYKPGGNTALYDAIGTAIDETGKWLRNMNEDDRPEKNLVVIMTDGGENSSRRYNLSQVKEMIKHQEDKYNWTFMYLGADLTNARQGNELGLRNQVYFSKRDMGDSYKFVSTLATDLRENSISEVELNNTLTSYCAATTTKYCADNNLNINVNADTKTI